jgi:hypothetical protein
MCSDKIIFHMCWYWVLVNQRFPRFFFWILVKCLYNKQNNTWILGDMNLSSCVQARYLTHLLHSLMRYWAWTLSNHQCIIFYIRHGSNVNFSCVKYIRNKDILDSLALIIRFGTKFDIWTGLYAINRSNHIIIKIYHYLSLKTMVYSILKQSHQNFNLWNLSLKYLELDVKIEDIHFNLSRQELLTSTRETRTYSSPLSKYSIPGRGVHTPKQT